MASTTSTLREVRTAIDAVDRDHPAGRLTRRTRRGQIFRPRYSSECAVEGPLAAPAEPVRDHAHRRRVAGRQRVAGALATAVPSEVSAPFAPTSSLCGFHGYQA